MSRTKKLLIALGVLALLLGIVRLAAPVYILGYVNRTLDGLDGYTGRVADIDLHIWRGAYQIHGVRIEKEGKAGKRPIPFVSAETVDISVQWAQLVHGAIVGEIDLFEPKLNFIAEKGKESAHEDKAEKREKARAQSGEETSWQKQVKQLVPLDINRIGIHDGEIHYRDPSAEPKVDLSLRKFTGELRNLTNSEELSKDMVATASFRGVAQGSGKLKLEGKVDPYQEVPTFSLDAQMEDLEIKELNDFLKAYANVDAERGTISVYTQIDCEKGAFRGYVKPLIRDLRILKWKDEKENFFHKIWEGVVEAGTEIFENDDKQQVATRVPLRGKLEQPNADIGTTVLYVLRNAFIQALQRGLDRDLDKGGKEGELAKRAED